MSEQHEPITVKPISDVAKFQKNLIPANIPEAYVLKPMFKSVAKGENIRNGVIVFRDFLYLFFDRLTLDGHLYAKPSKKPSSMADYPILHNITNLLVDIGYHGKLSDNGDSLLIDELPLCTPQKPKISASAQAECKQLREKIMQGYGCDRKRNERCQYGCQGIRVPLDDTVLSITHDIEIWLDNEMPKK